MAKARRRWWRKKLLPASRHLLRTIRLQIDFLSPSIPQSRACKKIFPCKNINTKRLWRGARYKKGLRAFSRALFLPHICEYKATLRILSTDTHTRGKMFIKKSLCDVMVCVPWWHGLILIYCILGINPQKHFMLRIRNQCMTEKGLCCAPLLWFDSCCSPFIFCNKSVL